MTLDETPAGPDGDVSSAVEQLEVQFGRLFDAYRQRLRERADDIDPTLQPAAYRTLLTLVLQGPHGAGPLAEKLGIDKSALSRQLHQLEEMGLASRGSDPEDRRAVIIRATPVAVTRLESARDERRDEFRANIAAWDPSDVRELIRLLEKLVGI